MMDENSQEVKGFGRHFTDWMDRHARTGWWLAGIGMLNVVLNLLQLFGVGG